VINLVKVRRGFAATLLHLQTLAAVDKSPAWRDLGCVASAAFHSLIPGSTGVSPCPSAAGVVSAYLYYSFVKTGGSLIAAVPCTPVWISRDTQFSVMTWG